MDLGELKVRINADIAGLSRGIQRAQAQMQQLGPKMKSIGGGMSSVGRSMSLAVTAPILLMGKLGLDELKEIQSANAQTAAAIRNVGKGSLVTAAHITKQAGALQLLSGQDDQAIQGAQNLLLRFANLNVKTKEGASAFDRAAKLAVNMGVSMGGPEAAAKALGKGLADPENAMTKLGKAAGLTKPQMAALKKQMEGVSSPAAKQAILLGALEGKYNGVAKAAGTTLGAKLAILQDRVAGVAARFLQQLIPAVDSLVGAATKLLDFVDGLSPSMQKWGAIIAVVAAVSGPLLMVLGSIVGAIGTLMPVFAALLGPIGLIIVGIVALGVALVLLWRKNEAFRDGVRAAWQQLSISIGEVLTALRATMEQWIAWGKTVWEAHGTEIMAVLTTAWDAIHQIVVGRLQFIKGYVQMWLAIFRGDWSGAWDGIKTMLSGIWNQFEGIVGLALAGVKTAAVAAWQAVRDKATTWWDSIKTTVSNAAGLIPGAVVDALSQLETKMEGIGSKAGTALANALKSAINAIINKWNDLEFGGFSVGKGKFKVDVPSVGTPDMATFARGGITNRPGIFGEAGPEAAVPLGMGRQAQGDRARVLGQIGAGGIHIGTLTIHANDAAGGRAAGEAFMKTVRSPKFRVA